jgi:hypothetical protein
MYGVCEKAVRDIWVGRTWAAETWHLDPSRPLKIKYAGRPLGCRDAKPTEEQAGYRAVFQCRYSAFRKEPDNGRNMQIQSEDAQCADSAAEWQTPYPSLDDLLFHWEQNAFCKAADPFQADWKLQQHGQDGPSRSISEAGFRFPPNSARPEVQTSV